ncbi:MAG: S1C family serine protease [Lachnospiraceae bacterium]|nr:S1C family serine protease [Lachnospiraceae bacterium]
MSGEEKQQNKMDDEKRAFIKEQVAPNKKNKWKKNGRIVLQTAGLSVLFGLVSAFVFAQAEPAFRNYFHPEEKNKSTVVLETEPTETPEPTQSPSPTPTKTPKKEPEVITEVVEADLDTFQQMYEKVQAKVEDLNHSVVKVSTIQNGVDWFDNPAELKDETSGIIVAEDDESYYILATPSEITDSKNIQITFSNDYVTKGTLLGSDLEVDIAVIRVRREEISEDTKSIISLSKLGDSDKIRPGLPVLALGNPNGYVYSMDIGNISSRTSTLYATDSEYQMFYTTMGSTTRGGGVIADIDGRIIGIISHLTDENSESNYCKALSINKLKGLIEQLMNQTKRVYCGIEAANMSEEYKEQNQLETGIYVTKVLNASPALQGDVKAGDIILDINGIDISSVEQYAKVLAQYEPGDKIKVRLMRLMGNEWKESEATIALQEKKN